jgi:hypothetical protein
MKLEPLNREFQLSEGHGQIKDQPIQVELSLPFGKRLSSVFRRFSGTSRVSSFIQLFLNA